MGGLDDDILKGGGNTDWCDGDAKSEQISSCEHSTGCAN